MRVSLFLLLAAALGAQASPTCKNCNPPFALGFNNICNSCEYSDFGASFNAGCLDWQPTKQEVDKLTADEIILLLDHPSFSYPLTVRQLNCNDRGAFGSKYNVASGNCLCSNNTGFFDDNNYCLTCAPGYINYPSCDTKGCSEANYCQGGVAIANVGAVCDDSALKSAAICGDDPDNVYEKKKDLCCSSTDVAGQVTSRVFADAYSKGSTCCGDNVCTWSQTCEEFETLDYIVDPDPNKVGKYKTVTKKKCFDMGSKKKCEKMRYNVDLAKWYIVDIEPIQKWQSCCGAEFICNSDEACVEHATDDLFPVFATQKGVPSEGWGSNDRLDWVRPPLEGKLPFDPKDKKSLVKVGKEDEGKVSFRKRCVPYKRRYGTAIYAGVLPTMLFLVTLVGAGLVISAAGTGNVKVFVPALLVILLSCVLYLSSTWDSGLLAALGAFMAIGAQAGSSDYKHMFSVIVQFFIFCALCGGMGLGVLFSSGNQFFLGASEYNGNQAADRCVSFYSYFSNVDNQRWNKEDAYEQLCSRDWVSATLFFSVMLVACFFLQLVASASLMADGK